MLMRSRRLTAGILAVICTSSTAVHAKGVILTTGTRITGKTVDDAGIMQNVDLTLDASRFLLERSDIDRCNTLESELEYCKNKAPIEPLPPVCPEPASESPAAGIWSNVVFATAIGVVAFVAGGVVAKRLL
jgi:hypothetical protein